MLMLLHMETHSPSIPATQSLLFIQAQLKTHCLDNTLASLTLFDIYPEFQGRYEGKEQGGQISLVRPRFLHESLEFAQVSIQSL